MLILAQMPIKPTDTRTANIGNIVSEPQIVGHEYSFPIIIETRAKARQCCLYSF